MKPKKGLGQNFLTSIPARLAIVEAAELAKNDTVLEIGPGKGFLTRALLDAGAHVVAVEKDRDLIPVLQETFADEISAGQLALVEGDALLFDPSEHGMKDWKLVANIPYYITGAIFERYFSMPNHPLTAVTLVQKEVAERACARDGKESILSLSIKVYGDPKLVYKVSKGSFHPIPKVDSAVLQVKNISRRAFKTPEEEKNFFRVVKSGFAHKRKFLISNLREEVPEMQWEKAFERLEIDPKIRAEDLSLQFWLKLSKEI